MGDTTSRIRPGIPRLLPWILAALLIGIVPATVGAAGVERYAYSETFSYDDCGFPIVATYEESGIHRTNPKGFELRNGRWRIVETNPETGAWFERFSNTVDLDIRAVLVEGTIYRYTTMSAGRPFVVRDMHGETVLMDRGRQTISYLIDTKGDADPDNDEFIDGSLEFTSESGPHPAGSYFETVDWCDFVTSLIG